jgi:DNA polymerase III epsilon subunit-like protein
MKYNYRKVLVFDVETTGLIPKKTTDLSLMPSIIQLSFVIFDVNSYQIIQKYNSYIKIKDIELEPIIIELTGITNEICETKGIHINDAITELYKAYLSCDCVIAHNLSFDKSMIEIEMLRNNINFPIFTNPNIPMHCTMMDSIFLCNIIIDGKHGKFRKFPKLVELYNKLFRYVPENLHNSMVDVLVCLRCFLKIKLKKEIHNVRYRYIMDKCVEGL